MIDINTPVANPELVEAINALQSNTNNDTEKAFLDLLVTANFVVPIEGYLKHDKPDSNGKITLEKDSIIKLPMLIDGEGKPRHIAFTDWPSLKKWREIADEKILVVPFSDFPAMILHENVRSFGLIINPNSHSLPVSKQLLAHLSGRSIPVVVEKETQVVIGEPANYPHSLVDAVKVLLKSMREVKRAWFLLMHRNGEQSFLVVVDFNGERSKIFDAIGKTASPYLESGQLIDIVQYGDAFGAETVKDYKPFYKRGLFF